MHLTELRSRLRIAAVHARHFSEDAFLQDVLHVSRREWSDFMRGRRKPTRARVKHWLSVMHAYLPEEESVLAFANQIHTPTSFSISDP